MDRLPRITHLAKLPSTWYRGIMNLLSDWDDQVRRLAEMPANKRKAVFEKLEIAPTANMKLMKTLRFSLDEQQKKDILNAIQLSLLSNGLTTFPEGLHKICKDYMDTYYDTEIDTPVV